MTVRHRSVEGRSWDKVLKEYTKSIFFAIFLAVLIRATLVQAYHIPSASMENTLLVGDYVLGDKLTFSYVFEKEELRDEGFKLPDGLFVEKGSYSGHRGRISLHSSSGRPVQLRLEYGMGDFFSGRRQQLITGLDLRLSRFFFLGLDYEQTTIRLPQGSGHTRLARLDLALTATPNLSWTTALQYDNVSDTLGLSSRIRWIVEPGNEIFLVFNESYEANAEGIHPTFSQATFKVRYTFRF